MKLRDANLQVYKKKLFHVSTFMYFALIFKDRMTIIFSKEALKVYEQNFFQEV